MAGCKCTMESAAHFTHDLHHDNSFGWRNPLPHLPDQSAGGIASLTQRGTRCLVLNSTLALPQDRVDIWMLRFLHARVAMHSLNFPSFILRRSTYRGRPGVCTHLRSPLPSPTLRAWLISQICLFACSPSDHPPAQLARLSLYCLQHLMPSTETSKWLLSLKVCMPTQMNKKNKTRCIGQEQLWTLVSLSEISVWMESQFFGV